MEKRKSRKWKLYRVGFWYTEYGTAHINAHSPKEAEKFLYTILECDGLEKLVYKCNDRDYGAQDAEEVTCEK